MQRRRCCLLNRSARLLRRTRLPLQRNARKCFKSIVDCGKSHVQQCMCDFFCPNACIYQKKAVLLQRICKWRLILIFINIYSILQLIASGLNHRSDIDGALQKDSGVYLLNLENNFGMVSRIRPILASPNSKISSYEITDPFLRFWFRFICPYQALIESGQLRLLRENINTHYEQFTGRTLERYFQTQFMETGNYSQVGNWWDKQGGNEIDVVALDEFNHTGLIAEVKRNERKLSMAKLEEKMENLLERYNLNETELKNILENKDNMENENILEIMHLIGRKRGAIVQGNNVDEEKTANLLLDEFRSGKIGRISLERPE